MQASNDAWEKYFEETMISMSDKSKIQKERKESEFIIKLMDRWVLVDIEANTWRQVSRADDDFEWTLFKQILSRDIVHVGEDNE